jgi:iron complex transport system substrate-binding protein
MFLIRGQNHRTVNPDKVSEHLQDQSAILTGTGAAAIVLPRMRYLLTAAAAAGFVWLGAACGGGDGPSTPTATSQQTAATPGEDFPITINDSNEERVRFEAAPQRIVVLSAGHVEMLFAVGAGASIVAAEASTDFPAEASGLPKLSAAEANVDSIAAFQPDLVLMSADTPTLRDDLKARGMKPLFLAEPDSLGSVYEQILVLGLVSGHEQASQDLVLQLASRAAELEGKLEGVLGPRILHESDFVNGVILTVGPGSLAHDLYQTLRAKNINADVGGGFDLHENEAIAADPEVIILADGVTPESVKARPGWDGVSAVRNDRLFVVDPDIINRPGPRLVDGLEQLAQLLYPEKFP